MPETLWREVRPSMAGEERTNERREGKVSVSIRGSTRRTRKKRQLTVHRVSHLMENRFHFLIAQQRRPTAVRRHLEIAIQHGDGQLETPLPPLRLHLLHLQPTDSRIEPSLRASSAKQPSTTSSVTTTSTSPNSSSPPVPLSQRLLEQLQISLDVVVVDSPRTPHGVVSCVS